MKAIKRFLFHFVFFLLGVKKYLRMKFFLFIFVKKKDNQGSNESWKFWTARNKKSLSGNGKKKETNCPKEKKILTKYLILYSNTLFQIKFGKTLEESLKSEISGNLLKGTLALLTPSDECKSFYIVMLLLIIIIIIIIWFFFCVWCDRWSSLLAWSIERIRRRWKMSHSFNLYQGATSNKKFNWNIPTM